MHLCSQTQNSPTSTCFARFDSVSETRELGEGFIFSEAVRDLYCMLEAYHARVADELFPILSELGDTEAVN